MTTDASTSRGINGLLIDEIPREKNESSRSYVGGTVDTGHLPLPEARRWSLDRVETLEDEVQAALAKVKGTESDLQAAQKARDAAATELHRLRVKLAGARRDLAWRLGMGPING